MPALVRVHRAPCALTKASSGCCRLAVHQYTPLDARSAPPPAPPAALGVSRLPSPPLRAAAEWRPAGRLRPASARMRSRTPRCVRSTRGVAAAAKRRDGCVRTPPSGPNPCRLLGGAHELPRLALWRLARCSAVSAHCLQSLAACLHLARVGGPSVTSTRCVGVCMQIPARPRAHVPSETAQKHAEAPPGKCMPRWQSRSLSSSTDAAARLHPPQSPHPAWVPGGKQPVPYAGQHVALRPEEVPGGWYVRPGDEAGKVPRGACCSRRDMHSQARRHAALLC